MPLTITVTRTRTQHAYGYRRDRLDHRDLILHDALTVGPLPAHVDLRETGHLDFPVSDQGQLGSCTANAIAAGIRYAELAQREPHPIEPSRLFIYFEERRREGTTDSDAGAELRSGLKVAAKGYPAESLWPYDIGRFAERPPMSAYQAARHEHVTRYYRVPTSPLAMKGALALGYPVVIGFAVYAGLESNAAARTGMVPMPDPHEAPIGGHAVLLTGYDDSSRLWTCRNSWGDWGDGGYFHAPYGYLDSPSFASDFWTMRRETET